MSFQSKKLLGSLMAAGLSAALAGAAYAEPSFSGFVDVGYNYNLNGQTANVLRTFDGRSNSIELQNAELVATGTTKDNYTYRLDLDFGTDASVTNYLNNNAGDEFDIQQAFVAFPCPVTKGVFTVGKFVTPFGAEVIEAKDDYNISRGFLFNYAIPLNHTGVKYDKSFGNLALTGGIVNGWDNMHENNKSKTVLVQAAYPVTSKIKALVGGAYGPEQGTATPSVEKNGRGLIDAVVTFTASDKLTLVANVDWGVEEGALTGFVPTKDNNTANWAGIALYANYAFSAANSGAVRFENFGEDGSRTATQKESLTSLTFTYQHKMKDVITRLEYRSDSSNKKAFTDDNGVANSKKSQSTIAAQVIYPF